MENNKVWGTVSYFGKSVDKVNDFVYNAYVRYNKRGSCIKWLKVALLYTHTHTGSLLEKLNRRNI